MRMPGRRSDLRSALSLSVGLVFVLAMLAAKDATAQPSDPGSATNNNDDSRDSTPSAGPSAVADPPLLGAPAEPVDRPPPWIPKRTVRISTVDYVLIAAGGAGALGGALVPPPSSHIRGGVLLDEDARD